MGIEIVPPNVNRSDVDFRVEEGRIHFALSAIKGCGGSAAEAIVASRRQLGPFRDLFDFCERIDPTACNRAAIETLIKAGAFDEVDSRRAALMAVLDRAMQSGASALADKRSGQKSLFSDLLEDDASGAAVPLPDVAEWPEPEKLQNEKDVLGFYLTSHPLEEHAPQLETFCSHTTADLSDVADRGEVLLGGMLSSIKYAHVRRPRQGSTATKYANFDLEDMHGMIRCILWPESFLQFGDLVQAEAIVAIRGVIDRRGSVDDANLIVNEIIPIDQLDARYTRGVRVRVQESNHEAQALGQLREILRGYPGQCEVQLVLQLEDGSRAQLRCGNLKVSVNAEMRHRIDDLLGKGNFRPITDHSNGSMSRRKSASNGNGSSPAAR